MTKITIQKATGRWVVRSGGAILGETENALELIEGDLPAVIYFPREDVAMAFLDKSETTSHCPHKGDATYYSIVNKSSTDEDAVWSYEAPLATASEIKGHLAFLPLPSVKVEQI